MVSAASPALGVAGLQATFKDKQAFALALTPIANSDCQFTSRADFFECGRNAKISECQNDYTKIFAVENWRERAAVVKARIVFLQKGLKPSRDLSW